MDCLLCQRKLNKLEDSDEDYGNYPTIPITYKQLKLQIRNGLSSEGRQFWWPYLPLLEHNEDINQLSNQIIDISEKKYQWAKDKLNNQTHHLHNNNNELKENQKYEEMKEEMKEEDHEDDHEDENNNYNNNNNNNNNTQKQSTSTTKTNKHMNLSDINIRTDEIMNLLIHLYDLKEPGLVKSLVNILVLMIPSVAVCFNTCCAILDRPDWFISPTAVSHRLKLYTFKELIKNYLPKEYQILTRIGALNSEFLNLLFIDLFFTLMPIPDVMRIMDSFLLEGSKIIHRFGLGLIFMNRDLLNSEGIRTGLIFWEAIRSRCHTYLNFNDLSAYSFNLKGNRFFSIFKSGLSLKRQTLQLIEGQGRNYLGVGASDPLNLGYITTNGLVNTFDPSSRILDSLSVTHLKSSLPITMEHEKFKLVFSTHRDGWNLDTLFKRTINMSPCIILIKSLQQSGIVGAYIPVPISPPTDSVRGNGTAFVFRLTREKCEAYRWNSDNNNNNNINGISNNNDTHQNVTISSHEMASVQFAIFTSENILIGGSALYGTNAIRIDSELKTCYCGPSDTYHNPPLLPEELIQPFIIGELEIFCPVSSAEKVMQSSHFEEKSTWKTEKLQKLQEKGELTLKRYSNYLKVSNGVNNHKKTNNNNTNNNNSPNIHNNSNGYVQNQLHNHKNQQNNDSNNDSNNHHQHQNIHNDNEEQLYEIHDI